MEFDIHDLDCEKLSINPLNPKLVSFMEKHMPTIKHLKIDYKEGKFTKSQVYRYVLLMYDANSDITKMHHLDHFGQKYQACGYSGFKLSKNNRGSMVFDKEVDDMVFGRNDAINDLIVAFLSWQNNEQWQHLIYLKEAMNGMTVDALGNKNTNYRSAKDYMLLRKEYMEVSQNMAHVFDETEDFVARFYYNIEAERIAIKSEDYARNILAGDDFRGDSPYPIDYKPEPIKFLGDDEVQVRERLS